MPNRDYAARSKQKGVSKSLILAIILLLLMVSGLGLWLLKENAPVKTMPTQTVAPSVPKSTLPSPPEEVYSYIRDLETREVPVDKNSKLAKLTKEQELQIERQKEEEKRREEKALGTQNVENKTQEEKPSPPKIIALTPEELDAKKAREKAEAEEKRKKAELKKQQEAKKAAEQKAKAEVAKITATVAKPTDVSKSEGKYGLQCGAFKNKAQAENMQARLAMAGYNARIASSGDWNRVFVGPVGDRAAASAAQSNARSVAECLIVGM